jgi:hypothetical protein
MTLSSGVEVVGDAASEAAHRLDLLGLEQLALQLGPLALGALPLRQVDRHAEDDAARVGEPSQADGAETPGPDGAVTAGDVELAIGMPSLQDIEFPDPSQDLGLLRSIGQRGPGLDGRELLRRVPGQLQPGPVDGDDLAVLGMDDDRKRSLLDGAAEPLLALEDLRLTGVRHPGVDVEVGRR